MPYKLVLGGLGLVLGCASVPEPSGGSDGRAAVAVLRTQHYVLRVYHPDVFSVHDAQGFALAAGISKAQLRSMYPELYKTLDVGIAEEGYMMDARFFLSARRSPGQLPDIRRSMEH